jgi:hypothetical protein
MQNSGPTVSALAELSNSCDHALAMNRDVKYWLALFGLVFLAAAVVGALVDRQCCRPLRQYEAITEGMSLQDVVCELGRGDGANFECRSGAACSTPGMYSVWWRKGAYVISVTVSTDDPSLPVTKKGIGKQTPREWLGW